MGHVLVAKLIGFEVKSIGLGIGFNLIKFKYKDINFKVNLIPWGGYSEIDGMEEEFYARKETTILALKKIAVLLAGSISNIIISFIVFFMMSISVNGLPIKEVENTEFIHNNNIQEGDMITHIDGNFIEFKVNKKIIYKSIIIKHDGIKKEIELEQYKNSEELTLQSLGIIIENNPLILRLSSSTNIIKGQGIMYTNLFSEIFTQIDKTAEDIGKSESMTNSLGDIMNNSIIGGKINGILLYIGILNLALVFLNLLPIPIMDGGRIVISICEMIMGRSINKTFISVLMWISLVLLIIFEIFFWRGI